MRLRCYAVSYAVSHAVPALAVATLLAGDMAYRAEIELWRRDRESKLRAADGWLTVAGLFWLKEGANTAGSAPGNDIVLPAGSAPDRAGVFDLREGKVRFIPSAGGAAKALRPDTTGSPDLVSVRDLTMFVVERGGRLGIRLKDPNGEMRRNFSGLKYFDPSERYRVTARFVPYSPPKMIAVPNILGQTEQQPSPGYAEFSLHGKQCRLEPVVEGDGLFFIFKDLTSGKQTYPPGRFLDTGLSKDGKLILDFNKAYNPPCAFTPYATCPLPPPQNHLPVAIEAGELRYGH